MPRGSYFQTDDNGFLVNPASKDKVQEKWQPVIEDIVDAYRNLYGEKLKSVYVRGSVATGEAVEGVSDIDTFAYVDLSKEKLKEKTVVREARKRIKEKHNFVKGVEMQAYPVSYAQKHNVVLNQSLCVYGEPVFVPKLKAGREMATHSPVLNASFKRFKKLLGKDEGEEKSKERCVWLMKLLLRVGLELTMERSQRYTRDLYRCYETFAEYYPEKEAEMREVLDLALNPTADKNKIKQVMDSLGAWLLAEVSKHFEIKG